MSEGKKDLITIMAAIASAHQQSADAADLIADSVERIADATAFMFSLGGLDEASAALGRALHPEVKGA